MNSMRILLTGKNGQLGRCFADVVGNAYELFAFDSFELDIVNAELVAKCVSEVRPDIIVNAAAYTSVDKAESEPDAAYAVNEQGPKHLAEQAVALGIPLIHVSTDYVFDGNAVAPYTPSNQTNPQGVYGYSKLAGERAVISVCDRYIILRTSWIFSEYGNNFVKTMINLARELDQLDVVADQYGCPTYAGDLAKAILRICDLHRGAEVLEWGVYHFCGGAPTSWHGFARTILTKAYEQGVIDTQPQLRAISSDQYLTPAKRPHYSVMRDDKLTLLGIASSDWLDSLQIVVNKL